MRFALDMYYARDMPAGSDGSAAGGGNSDLSEWQRSARDEGASSPRTFAGHLNRIVGGLYHIAAAKQLYRICRQANISRPQSGHIAKI